MSNLTFDGNVKVSWVATLSSTTSPSAAQLTAGTSLEAHITPDGLAVPFDTAAVDQSSLSSTYTNEAAGRRHMQGSITFKRWDATAGAATAAESTLVYRAEGYLVVRWNKAATTAFAATDKVDVYPVQCGQPSPANAAPNETQKSTVTVFSTADPSLSVTAAA